MSDTPAPRQEAPGAAVSAPQGSGGPGVAPQGPQGLQEAVQGFGVHGRCPACGGTPQAAIEAAAVESDEAARLTDVEECRIAHSARAAGLREALRILGARTTPDNPSASSDTADNSAAEAALERLRTENAAALSLIRRQDEAIQRVRNLANRIALDSPWGRDAALQFRLAVQPPTPDGPSVAELAANDRNWDVEQDGE